VGGGWTLSALGSTQPLRLLWLGRGKRIVQESGLRTVRPSHSQIGPALMRLRHPTVKPPTHFAVGEALNEAAALLWLGQRVGPVG
jgi:hypothetical protein